MHMHSIIDSGQTSHDIVAGLILFPHGVHSKVTGSIRVFEYVYVILIHTYVAGVVGKTYLALG